jgi:large subunit ribosomal protein L3
MVGDAMEEMMSEEKSENTTVVSNELVAKKSGMTRVFDQNGNHVPVTVLEIIKNFIVQEKTKEVDGYSSVKIGYHEKRKSLLNKPMLVELEKANLSGDSLPSKLMEFSSVENAKLGEEISAENFTKGTIVKITGKSKGKGFAGVIKRYGFSGGPAAHGSKFHRTTGSIGNRATPGRVWKGKKMPGHMGCETKTIKNLKIQELNLETGYILVKGSVPGHKNSFVKLEITKKSE